ncbi:MAG: hypothetical protein DRR11_11615 [Gammaproteobacteria bacterium]|nr:MAG: hypothetical protein DRR11_11615 [Gammaproteobacteria bacterium]RLA35645.1 MAG: hypothetical protein DRR15_07015 [Gammaproteobacteria bacterium]
MSACVQQLKSPALIDRVRNKGVFIGAAFVLALIAAPAIAQTDTATDITKPVYTEGNERCLMCHSGLRMELLSESPHGDADNPDSPFGQRGCESCHGPGSFHVSRSMRGTGRPPMITFGEDVATPREHQVEVCMDCHTKDVDEMLKIDGHRNARDSAEALSLSCASCHTIHQVPAELASEDAARSAALAARLSQPAVFTERGKDQCLLCHSDTPIQLMAETVHGDTSNPLSPFGQQGCESCHGKGSLHVTASLSGDGRPRLTDFGPDAVSSPRQQNQACLNCHRRDRETIMSIDAHVNAVGFEDISCATCHAMHPSAEPVQTSAPILDNTASFTAVGAEQCALCHHEGQISLINATSHGDASNPQSPFGQHECESCHGPGSAHIKLSIAADEIRAPMVAYGDDSHTPKALQSETCLACHASHDEGFPNLAWNDMVHRSAATCTNCHKMHTEVQTMSDKSSEMSACLYCHDNAGADAPTIDWDGSMHANDEVSCRNCHTVHVAGSDLLDKQAQTINCAACHEGVNAGNGTIAWHDSVHANNDLSCASCHQVHVDHNPLVDRTAQTQLCFSCHEDREEKHPRFENKAIRFEELNCSDCHDVHNLLPQSDDIKSADYSAPTRRP